MGDILGRFPSDITSLNFKLGWSAIPIKENNSVYFIKDDDGDVCR